MATLSVLNLNDTEQDRLADFLGHDIRVHRKFYCLPKGTLQLAKISKVLIASKQDIRIQGEKSGSNFY